MKIEFYKHNLSNADKDEARRVLDSIFLTSGDWTKEFEKKFAVYTGNKHAVGVASCTNALELAVRRYGIGPGDEVITTPMSFVATANAVEAVGAKPVFVDVEKAIGNINANLIESAITPRTKAIILVHLYGQMCDMKKIRAIADKYNLKVVEDAAHCIEGKRDGIGVGQFGDVACYSFYATKNLSCGEGGALTCNDQETYDWLMRARLHGLDKSAEDRYNKLYKHYDMEFLGFKCNLSNILAALLVHQIDNLDGFLAKKEAIARIYDNGFSGNPYISKPAVLVNSRHARHLYTIFVNSLRRDEYLHALQEASVGVAVNFRPIHLMRYYREKYGYKEGDFPVAENIGASTITLPFYQKLAQEEISYVIDTVNNIVDG
ncbi:hypothetical protein A3G55_00580 [Candidatus Giovannonibacteria bacterium RIFCSPLOWO2_12_FULL_44_25]|uniref:UDP-4-amino-4, 6-dideoxy-N-acetyl-beta-L-altrosamine transaminase n=2 Tax=Candidatus Giovannoniibacteriota TaxID=1752738 RepID=A0A1F5WAM4_9BACT|nr:MAG: Glutamine-scyllo-inositol transaminase [Parcubacteria group bacterium GW2011_GWC1_44_10]KKT60430.1 MAG: Glutamine-scyllo-inositol transaminase [Candidatus Giovannonibacteria bacterium GW2011_GWA1_44_25]KKU30288.1 MAG: Glutamine-scyllo-inositol transaminase [Candidatus Giovannonibacteria bacterium GW2011_GWB1_46_20]OGF50495.1 MAG: hypothetical protein A2120_02515 [Candidatus Giovannonibacteria bacterium GWA2_45_15]OGF59628.1 MAG: hypothetical protein A2W40_04410 [Candidatus Giovannonibac